MMKTKHLLAAFFAMSLVLACFLAGCAEQTDDLAAGSTQTTIAPVEPQGTTEPTQEHAATNEITVQFDLDCPCYIIDPATDTVVKASNLVIQGTLDHERRFDGTMEVSHYALEGSKTVSQSITDLYGLWTVYMKYMPSVDGEMEHAQYAYALYAQELRPEKLLVQIRNIDTSTGFADFENCLYAVCAESEDEAISRYQELSADMTEILEPFPT